MSSKLHKSFEKRLTQFVTEFGGPAQVAKEIGLTRQTVYRFMDGSSSPTLETLEKLALTFGVTVSDLVGTDDPLRLAEERARAFRIVRDALREWADLAGLSWPPSPSEIASLLNEIRKGSRTKD